MRCWLIFQINFTSSLAVQVSLPLTCAFNFKKLPDWKFQTEPLISHGCHELRKRKWAKQTPVLSLFFSEKVQVWLSVCSLVNYSWSLDNLFLALLILLCFRVSHLPWQHLLHFALFTWGHTFSVPFPHQTSAEWCFHSAPSDFGNVWSQSLFFTEFVIVGHTVRVRVWGWKEGNIHFLCLDTGGTPTLQSHDVHKAFCMGFQCFKILENIVWLAFFH